MSNNTTASTGNYTITYEPTKRQIIERLFLQGHITFNEMWTLLTEDDRHIQYVPMPYNPWTNPWEVPVTYTDGPSNTELYNGGATGDPSEQS